MEHKDSIVSYVKGKVAVELRAATMNSGSCSCAPHGFPIRSKPGKGVVCALKIGKGQLKLFPFTNRVDTGKGGDA